MTKLRIAPPVLRRLQATHSSLSVSAVRNDIVQTHAQAPLPPTVWAHRLLERPQCGRHTVASPEGYHTHSILSYYVLEYRGGCRAESIGNTHKAQQFHIGNPAHCTPYIIASTPTTPPPTLRRWFTMMVASPGKALSSAVKAGLERRSSWQGVSARTENS